MGLNPEERQAFAFLDFQGEEAGPAPKAGDEIQGYRLEREIGCGGGGIVYEATHLELDRRVAFKLSPMVVAELQEEGRSRVRREALTLAKLRHPNIIEIHDSGMVPGYRWVAMQLIEGPSLAHLLTRPMEGFPTRESADWIPFLARTLEQIAAALGHAHEAGILHRDIKPSNILLDKAGQAYLVDFGLARHQPAGQDDLTEGFLGTPVHAAPEQFRNTALSPATDVYGLGSTAFEGLTGRPPFPRASTMAGQRDVLYRIPDWGAIAKAPTDLVAIVQRCLEKVSTARYPHGTALAEDFRRFRNFQPVIARQRSWLSRQWLRARLRPVTHLAAFSLLVLLGASVGLGVQLAERDGQVQELQAQGILDQAFETFHALDYEAFDGLVAELDLEDPDYLPILEMQADRYLNTRDFAMAGEAYRRASLLDPSEENLLGMAFCAWQEGTAPQPAVVLSDPSSLRALVLMMLCAEIEKDWPHATQWANAALQLHDTSILLLLSKSHYLKQDDRIEESMDILERCANLVPRDAKIQGHLVLGLNSRNRPLDAVEAGLRAFRNGANSEGLLTATGNALLALGRSGEAHRLLQEYRSDHEEDLPVALRGLEINILLHSHRFQEAEDLVEELLSAAPDNLRGFELATNALYDLQRFDRALEIAKRLQADARIPWRRIGVLVEARVRIARGDPAEGIRLLKTLPDRRRGKRLLVKAYLATGDTETAEAICREMLERNPEDLGIRFSLIQVHQKMGRWEDAYAQALKAYGSSPTHPEVHFWLSRIYLERGETEQALRHAERVNRTHHQWPEAMFLQADCLTDLGREEEAQGIREEANLLVEASHPLTTSGTSLSQ